MVSKKTKEWKPLAGVHRRRALHRRRHGDLGHRARSEAHQAADGAQPAAQLPPVEGARRASRSSTCSRSSTSRAAARSAAGSARQDNGNRKGDEWLMLFVAGMWFQDLWTYDFRRTEMCIIPYATQMGEISFCAYNTGVGWRQVVEHMHKNATRRGVVQGARQARRLRQPEEGRAAARDAMPVDAEDPEGRPARRLRAAPEGGGARFDGAGHLLAGARASHRRRRRAMGDILGFYFNWGILLQIGCVIHFVRRRPNTYWLWIILMFGPLGSLAYILVEVLPDAGLLRGTLPGLPAAPADPRARADRPRQPVVGQPRGARRPLPRGRQAGQGA